MQLRGRQHKASPGILRGLGDQVEGPISHNDVNPVLFAGVIDDLSAEGKTPKANQEHRIPSSKVRKAGEPNRCLSWKIIEKSDTYFGQFLKR